MFFSKFFAYLWVRLKFVATTTVKYKKRTYKNTDYFGRVCIAFFCVLVVPSLAKSDDYDLGRRTGHFIGVNVIADLFKVSACRYAIKDRNPRYLTREHFTEAVSFVRERYKDNVELQRLMGDDIQLSRMHDELIRQTTPKLAKSVGENPTPQVCGFINAEIDNRILIAKARLP
jgi:hypothetical protein